ncbi:MAG: helix-turn-helix domain-containing protein [Thermodesulfobacteriota bacterium]
MTTIKPIKDEQTYLKALARVEALWGAPIDSPEGDELEVLMTLVEVYEEKNYPMPPSDPVEAIRFRMEQMDIKRKDLESYIGSKSRVSEILNRKRSLSMNQVIKLHRGLGIPYECLLGE